MADVAQLLIRPAQVADAEAISAVIVRALRETNACDYPADVIDRNVANNSAAIIAERIRNDTVLVAQVGAELGARIVGTASLNGDAVKGFFVAPDAQGAGVGAALMREIETLARQRLLPELRLQASITARGFYQRHGFAIVRESWFGNELTFVMLWRL